MLKCYLLFSLSLSLAACGHKTEREQPAAAPTPVQPKIMNDSELPEDFGFTATYSSFRPIFVQTTGGETLVKASKNRIQFRRSNGQEIIDCQYNGDANPQVRHILEGRERKPNALTLVNCLTVLHLTRPLANLDELCEEYGCVEETIDDFLTLKVLMPTPLWVEKETRLRVLGGSGPRMLTKVAGVPTESDFAFTVQP